MIRALYAIGADIIRIHFKNAKDAAKSKTETKNFVRDTFLGAEIIDETPDEITLQILIKHSEFGIEKAVRRMAIVALAANRDAIASLTDQNSALFESVIHARNDVKPPGTLHCPPAKIRHRTQPLPRTRLPHPPKSSCYTA